MGFYSQTITVPANTSQSNAVQQVIRLNKGVIHRVEIQFPPGCAGLVHIQILHGKHQFAPVDLTQDVSSDNETVGWREFYEIDDLAQEMTILGWNDDDTYGHTITVRMHILPKKILLPSGSPESVIQALKSMFTRD